MEDNKLEKKKLNYFKFVWIAGFFAILVLILVIVMKYKIYYERAIGYIYFYNCSEQLCYSNKKEDTENKTIYSKYRYDGEIPKITVLENNFVIINNNILYNYITGAVITEDYTSYRTAGNNIIVFSNSSNKFGVIDNNGVLLVPISYDEITSSDGLYYVVKNNDEEFYKLIDNSNNIILEDYDYIYEYSQTIVLVKNMKLTIQDIEGNLLIDKEIDVYDESRLASVTNDNNILYIKIYKGDKYYKYSYNIESKKLERLTS